MARMPKNIRQIGGREERIKVYMEDYVSTYLRRLQEEWEENGVAGMLVGSWQVAEEASGDRSLQRTGNASDEKSEAAEVDTTCVFLGGALALKRADLEGGRIRMTEEAWTEAYETLGTYFSGQELCGIFVCEGTCRRFRRQALFAVARECFPDQSEVLLYILAEDGEEIFYRITRKQEERLQGYYCYFERNESMQEYMMETLQHRQVELEGQISAGRRVVGGRRGGSLGSEAADSADGGWNDMAVDGSAGHSWGSGARNTSGNVSAGRSSRMKEGTLGDPVDSFREKMRQQQEEKERRKSGRGIIGLCAAMAVVVFVSGLALMQRERGGIQMDELLARLNIAASLSQQVSALPEETAEHYVGGTSENGSASVVVEEIPGNVYPTEDDEGETTETDSSIAGEDEDPAADPTDPEAAPEPSTDPTTDTSGSEPDTEISDTETEPQTSDESETESSTEPSTDIASPESSPEPTAEAISSNVLSGTGTTYVVQAGDSLYSISRRFYGTDEMVSVIKELNDLDNADLIKEGQTLLLP